jgi:hypothetical protein
MKHLSKNQVMTVAGGIATPTISNQPTPHIFDTCTDAIIHYLTDRNKLFASLLRGETDLQSEYSNKMRHFQSIAIESCSFESIRNSGSVGVEIFLS